MGDGFAVDPEMLRAAGGRAHQVIDELRAFDSRSIAVAAADVGRGGLARAIDAFSAQWQTSVAGFIEAGDAWGDHLVSSAAEYEAADRASAGALDAVLTSRDG